MIRTFTDKRTALLFVGRGAKGIPADVLKRARLRLLQIDQARRLEDLRVPPGNQLEALKGNRSGQYSIRVNDQWRVCFRWLNGDGFEVEFCDYH